ncbi:MAG TPA: M20/M25/M40 family metallo-hydrolase [Woeseiaceae bacterium]|nr:M20/M25/M40 family metallo-hydrolase [Woeseiaceae bacterium]
MHRCLMAFFVFTGMALQSGGLPAEDLRASVERYVEDNQKAILVELLEALSIPSVAADHDNIRRKAELLRRSLKKRGLRAELLETDGNPLVHGYLAVPGAETTLLLYCHYDGQPVDATMWQQKDPFQPVILDGKLSEDTREIDISRTTRFESDWRVYARSASDDTGPIIALLAAFDALDAAGVSPTSNIRVILDGEEEAGSPNLVPAIERYRDRLAADVMLILDGPLHQSGRPTVEFGARGILTVELTVFGPAMSLHSGHYGNWAPNPAMQLAQLLASMKDAEGRVKIAGYYDGIELDSRDRDMLDSVPDDLDEIGRQLGFSRPEAVGRTLQEALQYPSLNIRGLRSAWVGGESRTIVPHTATAGIDIRLLRETEPEDMFAKLVAHIEDQGFHIVATDPDADTRATHARIVKVTRGATMRAYRTDPENEIAQAVVRAIAGVRDDPVVLKRTSGGTVPIAPFIEALGLPALGIPTVNFDNNQHSPNENVRLGHFFDSIVTFAAILSL